MVAFQVEFLKTLEDGVRLVPDLEKLEKVEQFKVIPSSSYLSNYCHCSHKNLHLLTLEIHFQVILGAV